MSGTDTVSALILAPAQKVFDFMADPGRLTLWSFGTWKTTQDTDGLITGRALADNAQVLLRIDPDPLMLMIDYHLGATREALQPRIFARVVRGTVTGHGAGASTLILTALRSADMDDVRWQRMCRAHAFEVDTIKTLIESGHDHRD